MYTIKVWYNGELWFAEIISPMSPAQFANYCEEFPSLDIPIMNTLDRDDLEHESQFAKASDLNAV